MCNWKWKVPNQCVMLAASNSHWLGTFQAIIWKVPNQCVKFLPIHVIENEKLFGM